MVSVSQINSHINNMVADLVENNIRIYGREHQIITTLLTIFSAIELDFDGKRIRGWCDTLLFGESQSGKSETAKSLIKMIGRGGYISGEGLSHVGLQGGIDKVGNSNVIRPGIFSIHDREIVVIDEMQGMTKEEFGKLSDVRMSGIARIQKIKSFRAPARCRKIWTANPRPLENGSITVKFNSEKYPINLVRKLIVTYEDMTRFDLIVGYKISDFSLRKNARVTENRKCKFTPQVLAKMVNHIWSRRVEDYVFSKEAVDACFITSERLINNYTTDFPMVLGAGQPDKMARLSAAAAGLFNLSSGNTVDGYNKITILPEHVEWVEQWLVDVFNNDDIHYQAYATQCKSVRDHGILNRDIMVQKIKSWEGYSELVFALGVNSFITEPILRIQAPSLPSASNALSHLTQMGLVKSTGRGYRKNDILNEILQNEFNEDTAIRIPADTITSQNKVEV